MAKRGRPSTFSQEKVDEICNRIAEGESLRKICKDEHLPDKGTVFTWLLDEDKKDFHDQYARARAAQAENLFEETLEIADDGTNDYVTVESEDGQVTERLNGEHVQRSRLRVDTRKWYLSKVLPKKYGEKIDVTSDGEKLQSITYVVKNAQRDTSQSDISEEPTEHEED